MPYSFSTTVSKENQREGEGIPCCLHDQYINTIATRVFFSVDEETGTAGVIVRIAELYYFRQMADLIRQFCILTGYQIREPRVDGVEGGIIHSQLQHLEDMVRQKHQEARAEEVAAAGRLADLKNGRVKLASGADTCSEILRQESRIACAQRRAKAADQYLDAFVRLQRLAEKAMQPSTGDSAQYPLSELTALSAQFPAVAYAVSRMDELKSAIAFIIRSFTSRLPARGQSKSAVMAEINMVQYYHRDSAGLRNLMSYQDYNQWCDAQMKKMLSAEYKYRENIILSGL